ncbi:hypothetical protein D1872_336300 [compost metagenome]
MVAKAVKAREAEIEEKKAKKKAKDNQVQGSKSNNNGFGDSFAKPTNEDPFSESKPIDISDDDLPF